MNKPYTNVNSVLTNKHYSIAKPPPLLISYGIRKHQCAAVTINGENKYAKIELPSDTNMQNIKKKIDERYKLYNEDSLLYGPDGVYTWIFSDKGFFAIKTMNITEIATLHMAIAKRTEADKIYLSGELLKTNNKILFNILSGQYMAPLAKKLKNNSVLKSSAKKLFNYMGLNAVLNESNRTFIIEESLPLTINDLLDYKLVGFKITLYNTKEECLA